MRNVRFRSLALGAVIALLLAACGGDDPAPAEDAAPPEPAEDPADPDGEPGEPDEDLEPITLQMGSFQAGVTGMVWSYIIDERLDLDFGIDLDLTFYTSANAMFGDLASGVNTVSTGSFDVYAGMAAEGLPLELIASIAPNSTFIIGREPIDSFDDLAGKRIAATTTTGAYRLAEATFIEWYDFDLNTDAEIMPADNPGAATAQLLAGTADYVLTWEPAITQALMGDDSLMIVYDQRADWIEREGGELWQFGLVKRTDMDVPDEAIERLIALLHFASEAMLEDLDLAEHYATTVLDAPEGLYRRAISEGRINLSVLPLSEGDVRAEHQRVVEFEQEYGLVPDNVPDSYWGG